MRTSIQNETLGNVSVPSLKTNTSVLKTEVSKLAISILLIFASYGLRAHGDDHPGPNGGAIRMPGSFHTELIVLKEGFKILLLDVSLKNPIMKDSSLQAKLVEGNKEQKLECQAHPDHFFCPTSKVPTSGKLILKASRAKLQGAEAVYDLPIPKK
ncbi:hypothetical protein [Leptospira adleri]|uniref:Uncharacterized protein n=1 Tax=Leptospira adleri TaxID=2023186 RepID=A0A2M9YRL7_9LEPT|nr:hypothetical protein [Leptospira adleri]PJZ54185.1 hypothetical protein CH380_06660 [Leptospira adleri]PJZ62345.1 hypothetical protein CH376_08270 [Leptospira adleri]